MSTKRQHLIRICVLAACASTLLPTTSGALEYDLLTVLHWDTTGDANPDLAYSFQSRHELEITECTLYQCLYPVVFNTGIYKNSPIFGLKDICNRYGFVTVGVVYTCTNSYAQACPLAEGQWYATSEAEIGFTVARRTVGPVFANCPATGGCDVFRMTTSILPLDEASTDIEGVPPLKGSNRLAYTLSRTKLHDGVRFLMDEWAVTSPEGADRTRAPRSSSDKFHGAVGAQLGHRLSGPFLVIQGPVHERNSRWIPLPEIHLTETALAANRRGSGEVIAVRAEMLDPPRVGDLQVLYASSPVDESWLEQLLRQRIALRYKTTQEHPAVAFIVLRLGEQLEPITSRSVLPKCCPCEPGPCIPD